MGFYEYQTNSVNSNRNLMNLKLNFQNRNFDSGSEKIICNLSDIQSRL